MVLTTAAMQPGSFHNDAEIIQGNVLAATTFAAGDVVMVDPTDNTFKQAGAGATLKRWGIAVEASTATAAAKKIRVAVSGHVVARAQGGIDPHNRVIVGSTAGRVAEATEGTVVANNIVGTYIGKADGNERDGVTVTAAVDGDPVWIRLGIGG
jgi:hypothetical protein